jgi:hypothetical protein
MWWYVAWHIATNVSNFPHLSIEYVYPDYPDNEGRSDNFVKVVGSSNLTKATDGSQGIHTDLTFELRFVENIYSVVNIPY